MLSGESTHKLDAKFRVTIPAKLREELGGSFVVTKGTDRCLNVFSAAAWAEFEENLVKLPRSKDARDYIRHMAGSAEEVNTDSMGRVLLSAALRHYAGLEKEVVLAGVLDRVEIWDKELWQRRSDETQQRVEEIAENLAELGYSI